MGSSDWRARVPYREDIHAARQEAYDRGAFYREPPDEKARSMGEQEYVAWGIAWLIESAPDEFDPTEWTGDEYREGWRAAQVTVTGPDSLLESQPFSGTHSVIDMTHVADEADEDAVAPMPPESLLKLFGTVHPTVAAVEAAIDTRQVHGFDRGRGVYLVGYADAKPDTIFFVGHSGD